MNSVQHPRAKAMPQALVASVGKLEETAERISIGSDLGEEIRKIWQEQKCQDKAHRDSLSTARKASGSLRTYSIVEVNESARRGGFSPTAYIPSPAHSMRSSVSDTQQLHIHRTRTASNPTPHGRRSSSTRQSSFQREGRYMPCASLPAQSLQRHGSGASRTTSISAFKDFDGVHYISLNGSLPDFDEALEDTQLHVDNGLTPEDDNGSDSEDEEAPVQSSAYQSVLQDEPDMPAFSALPERVEIMPAVQTHQSHPAPTDNMVYYPAPVPVNLKMPKRLSKIPAVSTHAAQKSQILGDLQSEARQSAVWLHNSGSESTNEEKRRRSYRPAGRANLPPQLRASVFFDQDSIPHTIRIKDGSAVATLDSFLDASARAPQDHSPRDLITTQAEPSSSSRPRSGMLSKILDTKPPASKSQTSLLPPMRFGSETLSDALQGATNESSGHHEDEVYSDHSGESETGTINPTGTTDGDERSDFDTVFSEQRSAHESHIDPSATPTTLLAELQLRKQQLKSRTRTAAVMFPNGMHSTLLELDAVEQIAKKRRQDKRTTLAWEETATDSLCDDDDDVPLGVLYSSKSEMFSKHAGVGWDRPLGLVERRHIEDNEPLSRRRDRLTGVTRNEKARGTSSRVSEAPSGVQAEDENETLAQRIRRLKAAKALDAAIQNSKGDFASELLSQLGGLDEKDAKRDKKAAASDPASVEKEETLGQRRKRLLAEKAAAENKASAPVSLSDASKDTASSGTTSLHKTNEQRRMKGRATVMQNVNASQQSLSCYPHAMKQTLGLSPTRHAPEFVPALQMPDAPYAAPPIERADVDAWRQSVV